MNTPTRNEDIQLPDDFDEHFVHYCTMPIHRLKDFVYIIADLYAFLKNLGVSEQHVHEVFPDGGMGEVTLEEIRRIAKDAVRLARKSGR